MDDSQKRHHGFVVGSSSSGSAKVWSVRVKDPSSSRNGKKLKVASTHDDIALARGLNVHFLIGSVDGPTGEETERAVDVALATQPKS